MVPNSKDSLPSGNIYSNFKKEKVKMMMTFCTQL